MNYEVVSPFVDLQNNNYHYNIGDKFPIDGNVSSKRLADLSSNHNRQKKALIKEINSLSVSKTEQKANYGIKVKKTRKQKESAD